jgi:hypothetical protein
MNATATVTAVEQAPVVEGYTAAQIKEFRQRIQATGKVIAPVLTSLAGEMFDHGVSNRCIFVGVREAVHAGLDRDIVECLQEWGMDQGTPASDGRGELLVEGKFMEEAESICRKALVDAFVDWSFDQGDDA